MTENVAGGTEVGDEVSEVARSFNRMAEDLAARARALEASAPVVNCLRTSPTS
jgi:nitrate/nitrite-specific signal transduction histidine kinase